MATKRNQAHDAEASAALQVLGDLVPQRLSSTTELFAQETTAASDLLQTCCAEFRTNYERFVSSTLSALQHALAAGKFVVLMKELVGHGNFRSFCEREFPNIGFRRIEQFKRLAENEDELLAVLRSENAQQGALLPDRELLATTSIRKAQRILNGPVVEGAAKRRKRRGKSAPDSSSPVVSDELLMPQDVLAAAVRLLATIDLDPCAAFDRPHHIPARHCLTRRDDGLQSSCPWPGNVLLHPPFNAIADWVTKLRNEFEGGALQQALLLAPAQTDAPWFVSLAGHPRAFLRKRLAFPTPADSLVEVPLPLVVLYVGPADKAGPFAAAFADLADTYQPVSAALRSPGAKD
jgi:hypothetical protein